MNTTHPLSIVLPWLIAECINLMLRPVWLRNKQEFEEYLSALDCYPCRVGYDLGEFPQLWIQTPVEAAAHDNDFGDDWFQP